MKVRDVTNAGYPGDWDDITAATHREAAVKFVTRLQGSRQPTPKVVEVRATEHSVSSVYEFRREITAVPVDPNA